MTNISTFPSVGPMINPISNEDAALAVDKIDNLLFATTMIMQEYGAVSREHRAVCTLVSQMEEPLALLKDYCASDGFQLIEKSKE